LGSSLDDQLEKMPGVAMKLTALKVHKWWLLRASLVLVLTGLAEAATVWFARKPAFFAALVASTLPLSMVLFVVIPILRQESRVR
jgi:hypothetical protein